MHNYTRKGMFENSVDICITCKGLSLWTYTHNKTNKHELHEQLINA